MKIGKHSFFLGLFLLSCGAFAGCSDDDEDADESEYIETQEDVDEANFLSIASSLLDGEQITEDSIRYTFSYGEVLDESTPKVRTMGLNAYAEALDWFVYHCVPCDQRDNYKGVMGDITIDLGAYGSLTYRPSQTADLYASIYLNLTEVPDVTRLDLIPSALWPKNQDSDFYVGDIVYDTQGVNGIKDYYICVRACEGGQRGLLLSLSNAWREEPFREKVEEQVSSPFYIHHGTDEDAWQALAQYYYEDEDNFAGWVQDVAETCPEVTFMAEDKYGYSYVIKCLLDYSKDETMRGGTYCDCADATFQTCVKKIGWKQTKHYYKVVKQKLVEIYSHGIELESGIPKFKVEEWQFTGYEWVNVLNTNMDHHSEEFYNSTKQEPQTRFTKIYPLY